jgi:hypothetical protein
LWAEAKAEPTGVHEMLAQLILTIGEAGTVGDLNPAAYLGCFDTEKMAFAPYHALRPVFGKSDINWKTAPSDHTGQSFKNVCEHIRRLDEADPGAIRSYDLRRDAADLAHFIKQNFVAKKTDITRIRIDKNNFPIVYGKWLGAVRSTISVDWDATKKGGIIDADFFLADLLSDGNQTLKDKLFVVLRSDKYLLNRRLDDMGLDTFSAVDFTDGQRAHTQFWTRYGRPPSKDRFASGFMADYIGGKVKRGRYAEAEAGRPLVFSAEARTVFDAGRELWRRYHATPGADVNAGLYDIREHFKGRSESGRMNAKSEDGEFNALDAALRAALKTLAKKIEPKVYLHGFLGG